MMETENAMDRMDPNPYRLTPQNALRRPESHLTAAILVTIFCCMPLGIVAIVKAAGVDSAWAMGDYEKACRDSVSAWQWVKWSILALVVPLAFFLLLAATDFLMH